jgi:hypothetical protein
MSLADFGWHNGLLMHIAALIMLAGLMMRDQINLRALVLVGNALYVVYYFVAPPLPLWDAMFWSAAMVAVNLVMIVVIWRGRQHFGISEDALRVFGAFQPMEPGDFRQVMALGHTATTPEPLVLTRLGEVPERLYFVAAGAIKVERADRTLTLERPAFIGEVAFMLNCPATATVTLAAGGRYVHWDGATLRKLLAKRPRIEQCFERAFSRDLAVKLQEPRPSAAE